MEIKISKLTKPQAEALGVEAGWMYVIDDTDASMAGYGYKSYRATLEALLKFASK